ncbi:SHOCT domain-containing protein [Kitasatospora sp. NPDC088346]|uniref:SHOCT domain-containing protein n=1 Tax=Kitasatospora sp. NPDC088346 TaxID=3364073 RepID=UPI00380A0335
MRYWNDHDMGGWGFGLMIISVLLLLGLLVVVAIAVTRHPSPVTRHPSPVTRHLGHLPRQGPPNPQAAPPPSPERLLAERFARGEIDADEYRHRLDTLRSGSAGPVSG